ncbi:MAG: VUT family protein [Reyranellaceae bacterium]
MSNISRGMALAIAAMVAVVAAANYTVQFPVNAWLTWGALIYPVTFLVTDLANRAFGPGRARRMVYAGFVVGVVLSGVLAPWRIALASGIAFLVGQLLDIHVFDRLRRASWWKAPFVGSALGSVVDTAMFFGIAFIGVMPLLPQAQGPSVTTLSLGDLAVKLALALVFLAPFRALMNVIVPIAPRPA